MLMRPEEHVADRGAIYCAWRRCDARLAECTACPGFKGLRNAATTDERAVDIVTCAQPIPLA